MDRDHRRMTVSGTRDEIIEDLRESATGWHHLTKDQLRDQAVQAAEAVEEGSDSATVGHWRYTVTDQREK